MNLVTIYRNTEEFTFTQQKELLFLAFEQKLQHFNKQELLTMKSFMRAYIAIESSARNDIYLTYIRMINLYLKKAN
jgi:hypothetical protein